VPRRLPPQSVADPLSIVAGRFALGLAVLVLVLPLTASSPDSIGTVSDWMATASAADVSGDAAQGSIQGWWASAVFVLMFLVVFLILASGLWMLTHSPDRAVAGAGGMMAPSPAPTASQQRSWSASARGAVQEAFSRTSRALAPTAPPPARREAPLPRLAAWSELGVPESVVAQVSRRAEAAAGLLQQVSRVILLASGKGGVGKSTLTVNLAFTMATHGQRIGILDADVLGMAVPKLAGLRERQRPAAGGEPSLGLLEPAVAPLGVRIVSAGMLAEEGRTQEIPPALGEIGELADLVGRVVWGKLDVLFLDLPPLAPRWLGLLRQLLRGCADRLTVVLVAMPSRLSHLVVHRTAEALREAGIQVIGLIENMGSLACPHSLFTAAWDDKRWTEEQGIRLLGSLPFDPRIAACADHGAPFVLEYPDAPARQHGWGATSEPQPARR